MLAGGGSLLFEACRRTIPTIQGRFPRTRRAKRRTGRERNIIYTKPPDTRLPWRSKPRHIRVTPDVRSNSRQRSRVKRLTVNYIACLWKLIASVGTAPRRRFHFNDPLFFSSVLMGGRKGDTIRGTKKRKGSIVSIARGSKAQDPWVSGGTRGGGRCIPAHRSPAKAEIKINRASSPPGNIPADARYSARGRAGSFFESERGPRKRGDDREFGDQQESRV